MVKRSTSLRVFDVCSNFYRREEAVSRFVEIKGGGGTEQVREGVEVVEGGGRGSWEQITMMDMVVLKLALKQLSGSISLKNSLR